MIATADNEQRDRRDLSARACAATLQFTTTCSRARSEGSKQVRRKQGSTSRHGMPGGAAPFAGRTRRAPFPLPPTPRSTCPPCTRALLLAVCADASTQSVWGSSTRADTLARAKGFARRAACGPPAPRRRHRHAACWQRRAGGAGGPQEACRAHIVGWEHSKENVGRTKKNSQP